MTNDLFVRPFQSSDAEAVVALWEDALPSTQPWNEPRRVICRKRVYNDNLLLVGEIEGRLVATAMAGYDGVRGWIYAVAVPADCRRQGIGRRMLAATEQALVARGCQKVNLQVRTSNSQVIAFYEQCGYACEDRASMGKPLPNDLQTAADPVPTIEVNDQLRLSQINWGDKAAYLRHLNATAAFRDKMGIMPFPYTDIDADQWIGKAVRETLEHDRARNWAVRNADGELIGGIGVMGLTQGEKAEIGYWLAEAYWGRGLITAAARKLSEFVFEEYQVAKIFGQVFSNNAASARVLEKSGFDLEGTLRNHFFRDGQAYDVMFFGRLNPGR